MENKKKHRTTFIIKSFLIIAILLFKYKAVTFIKSDKSSKLFTYLKSTFNSFTQSTIDFSSESKIIESTNKSFTQSIIAIIIILFVIINLNISSDLDFNTEVSTYINIFYIFIILTLGIILNYSDYINVNKKKTIALTIFITLYQ